MNFYGDMIKALEAVGLYEIKDGGWIDSEIKSYDDAFSSLESEVDDILRECVVLTAEEDGIIFYERLIGSSREELNIEKRREAVCYLLNLNRNDNTPDGIQRFFKSLNFDCEIVERPSIYDLYIRPKAENYSRDEKTFIVNRAKKFLPCHLSFSIDFRTETWDDYDRMGKTFRTIDAMNLTWEEFEMFDI